MWFWKRFFSFSVLTVSFGLGLDSDSNLFGLGLDSDSNLFGLGLDSDSNLFGLGLVLDSTKMDLTTALSPAILKTFYSGAIESVLTQCISVWYNNATNQDCKALQRVVRLAERISGSTLPSLQGIYLKRCRSRAAKITKDSTHPGNHLFRLLPSGRRYRSLMAKTERLRKSFFPQAIRLLNTNSVP